MKNIELIDNFFVGNLDTSQQKDFNDRLETDTDLKNEVKFYLASKAATKNNAFDAKKQHFEELHKQLLKENRNSSLFVLGGIAAAILIFVLSWTMFFNSQSPAEYANVYIKNNLSTIPTQMSAKEDSLNLGIEFYNNNDYSSALAVLKSIKESPKTIEYQGLCYLQLKEYEQAISQFEKLAANQEVINNKGAFYQSLVFIQQGKYEIAKQKLEEIIRDSQSETSKKDAIELLKLIK